MTLRSASSGLAAVVGMVSLGLALVVAAQPEDEAVLGSEITADGLHRVHPSIIPSGWVREDVDLSDYTRAVFVPTIVQFREFPHEEYSKRWTDPRVEFPVSELSRPRIRELFGETFYEAASRIQSHDLTKEFGRDVLMIQGYLTDVVTGVPPDLAGSNVQSVRWALEAKIVLELRDSMSDDVLARTIDHQRIDGPFAAAEVYSITPRVLRGWSSLLATRFRQLSRLYPSRLRRRYEENQE